MSKLRDILQATVGNGSVPGAVSLVARDGRVEVQAVGSVATPTLKFTPENKHGRTVLVSVSGCGIDYVTVNGASQPSLWDQDGRLPALTRKLIAS